MKLTIPQYLISTPPPSIDPGRGHAPVAEMMNEWLQPITDTIPDGQRALLMFTSEEAAQQFCQRYLAPGCFVVHPTFLELHKILLQADARGTKLVGRNRRDNFIQAAGIGQVIAELARRESIDGEPSA